MVIIIPYKRSTLESLEPTWIVLMSELTFASSRTGGMGRIMISMGTRWTSFTAAECTLLSEAIARNDVCIKQHIYNYHYHQTNMAAWKHCHSWDITSAITWRSILDVEQSGENGVNGILRSPGERNQRITNFSKWIFENMPTTALGTDLLFLVWRLWRSILNAKNKEQTLTSSQTLPLNIKTSMNSKLPEEKSKR